MKAAVAAAVGSLANQNNPNKKYFMDSGACWIILKLLELSYSNGAEYVTACAYCISNVAESDSNLQYQYHNWDTVRTILKALRVNNRAAFVCVQCFRALRSLTHDNVLARANFVSHDPFSDVIEAINLHPENDIVAEWGWTFVCSIIEFPAALEGLLAAGLFDSLAIAFRTFHSQQDVSIFTCQALNKLGKDPQFAETISSLGLCQELMKCVRELGHNQYIAEEGCNAIGTVAGVSADMRRVLVEDAAFAVVVKVYYAHEKRSPVAEQCLYAIANLSIGLPSSKAHSFCFKAINKALPLHKKSSGAALWGFIAITRLCQEDANMSRLLIAPSTVTTTLAQFPSNAEVITWGLRSILGLLPPAENLPRFVDANIAECLANILSRHVEVEVVAELVLIIVAIVSANDTVKTQLGALNACTQIAIAMDNFKLSPVIAINGCKAIARLAFNSPVNIETFLEANAVKILCLIMELHAASEEVLVAAAYAFSSMASSDGAKPAIAAHTSTLDMILTSVRRSRNVELSTACCAVVSRLAMNDEVCKVYLGEHGACDDVLGALIHFIDDPTLCREACYAVLRLTEDCPVNALLHGEECVEYFALVLSKHAFMPGVSEKCLSALYALVSGNPALIDAFGRDGLCEALLNLFKVNLKSEILVEKILQLVYILSPLNEKLGEVGFCTGVISALVTHSAVPSASQWACCAICSLAEHETNRATLGALQACEAVVELLGKYTETNPLVRAMLPAQGDSGGVALWACKAIHALGENNRGLQTVLGTAGACDLVARALSLYKEDANIAVACCMAAFTLSAFNATHKEALGEAGICSDLVEILRIHVANRDVALWSTRAIASLAIENDNNTLKFVAAGACETLPVTMQGLQRDVDIAGAGCSIIASLAANFATAGRLGHNGAVEAIVSALQLHSDSELVVTKGAMGISRMAQSVGNTSWLGPAGACEALLEAIKKHTENETVSYEAWYAVGSMAVDINNCIRLGAAGACEMVVAALILHPESDLIVEAASRAVGKLSKFSKNAAIIHSSGDCDVIISSFRAHKNNEMAAYQLCQTLSILSFGDKAIQARLGALGACELVVDALRIHQNSEMVVPQGLMAVKSLAYQNAENQSALREVEVCPFVLSLMEQHCLVLPVNQAGCWSISNLCAGSDSNNYLLGSLGACETVVTALKVFVSDNALCQYATSALYHLTLNNDKSANKCSFSGAAPALLAAVTAHAEDAFIAEHALLAMKHMCCNSIGRHKLRLAGACKAIVTGFLHFDEDRKIVLLLLNLVFAMSLENVENQVALLESGVLKRITGWLLLFIDLEEATGGDRPKLRRSKSTESAFYVGNSNKAFATESSITDEACLAIASLAEGHEALVKKREVETAASMFGAIIKITQSLDSTDAIMQQAKDHIKNKLALVAAVVAEEEAEKNGTHDDHEDEL